MSETTQNAAPDQPDSNEPAPQTNHRGDTPSHDQIAERAYAIYLERGGDHGLDEDDWIQAEQELVAGNPDGTPSQPVDPASTTGAT
jgi:hypothetical protein